VHDVYPNHPKVMSLSVAEQLIQSAVNTNVMHISFCWQGGEPTLAGLDFFRAIVALQRNYRKPNQAIENSIQTNGVLLDSEWCRFLSENNFLVGVSLDGPKEIHDCYRKDYAGRGSFDTVMAAIACMNKYSVQYNILTLLTDSNIAKANEIYSFFCQNNFSYLQFIPCFEYDEYGNRLPYSVTGNDLGNFYCKLFDEWYRDGFPYVQVRLFQDILLYAIQEVKTSCCWMQNCDSYIVVEHNGDCYPCDFFVYPEWHLGNIMNYHLLDILNNEKRNRFAQLKREINQECSICSINNFCMGDCTRYRFTTTINQRGTSKLCEAWKMLFDHYRHYEKELVGRVSKLQQSVQSGQFNRLQRNDTCPCGSGNKFKKCCGRAPLAI